MTRTAPAAAIGSALSLCLTLVTKPAVAQMASSESESGLRAVRPNRALLLSGTAILVAAYAPSAIVAATSDRGGDEWLYVPLVGPWADLSARAPCAPSGGNCNDEDLYELLIVTAGIAQTVGVVGILSSFVVPEYRKATSAALSVKPEVRVSPMRLTESGYGVGAIGRF